MATYFTEPSSELLAELYGKYYHRAYLYALSLCREKSWAEDIVSEAFEKAMLTLEDGGQGFLYWLLASNFSSSRSVCSRSSGVALPFLYFSNNSLNVIAIRLQFFFPSGCGMTRQRCIILIRRISLLKRLTAILPLFRSLRCRKCAWIYSGSFSKIIRADSTSRIIPSCEGSSLKPYWLRLKIPPTQLAPALYH